MFPQYLVSSQLRTSHSTEVRAQLWPQQPTGCSFSSNIYFQVMPKFMKVKETLLPITPPSLPCQEVVTGPWLRACRPTSQCGRDEQMGAVLFDDGIDELLSSGSPAKQTDASLKLRHEGHWMTDQISPLNGCVPHLPTGKLPRQKRQATLLNSSFLPLSQSSPSHATQGSLGWWESVCDLLLFIKWHIPLGFWIDTHLLSPNPITRIVSQMHTAMSLSCLQSTMDAKSGVTFTMYECQGGAKIKSNSNHHYFVMMVVGFWWQWWWWCCW